MMIGTETMRRHSKRYRSCRHRDAVSTRRIPDSSTGIQLFVPAIRLEINMESPMSHVVVPVHSIDTAPEPSRSALQAARTSFGFIPNLVGAMAESPALAHAYMAVNKEFSTRSSLTPPEQQLILLAVSYVNGCRYCMAAHSGLGQAVGLSPDHVAALRNGASLKDPRLEALRTFTQAMVRDRGHVSRETAETFLAAGFTTQAILDVILGIAFKTMSNYTDNLFEAPLDEGLKKWGWTRPAP
jgi:uncharacterized peroxidase-related enzyme